MSQSSLVRPSRPDLHRNGRHIPDLLEPRPHVSVDPAVRGGEPVLQGTRIPAAEVAALVKDAIPLGRISDFYPRSQRRGSSCRFTRQLMWKLPTLDG